MQWSWSATGSAIKSAAARTRRTGEDEFGRDRRSRIIVMTRMGRQHLAEAKPLWRRAQKRFAAAFDAEGIHALRALLTTAVAADYGDATAGG